MGEREDYDLIALDLIGNRKGKAIQHGDPTVRAVVPLGHSFRELEDGFQYRIDLVFELGSKPARHES